MGAAKSEFLNELKARGYVHQVTDEPALDRFARAETITGYIGFDCTAPSLHVGNLLGIMMLRKLQQAGHRPIVLIGGGTTKVGDPSGKDESRKLLSDAEIAANIGGMERMVCGLAREFDQRGWKVRSVFPQEPGSPALLQWCADQGVAAEADPEVVVDLLTAPFFYRRLVAHRPLPKTLPQAIVDQVLPRR